MCAMHDIYPSFSLLRIRKTLKTTAIKNNMTKKMNTSNGYGICMFIVVYNRTVFFYEHKYQMFGI